MKQYFALHVQKEQIEFLKEKISSNRESKMYTFPFFRFSFFLSLPFKLLAVGPRNECARIEYLRKIDSLTWIDFVFCFLFFLFM